MAKTFGEVSQFTPLFDEILQKYDRNVASVYGRIWRRCQGKYGCCSESIVNMARELKMSQNTVRKSITILENASEIFPEERQGKTTLYRVTPTKIDRGILQTPTKTDRGPLPKQVDEDTNNIEHSTFKKIEQLKQEAKKHFSSGPRRNKKLDSYYEFVGSDTYHGHL